MASVATTAQGVGADERTGASRGRNGIRRVPLNPFTWWRWLRQWRRHHLRVDRIAVLRHVDEAGAAGPRYAFMTLMSCGIAILGLLQNSAAVIIGAMLISPLMGPIVEMGMSLATLDLANLRSALRALIVGVVVSLATAVLIVLVSPLQEATPEILARTQPTLFDLLVAVFSGLAGGYATVTRKGETIVGVAIATALMPPLAVIGFGLATWNMQVAGGAAFLFMTNLLAIALSVTAVARWYRFRAGDSPKHDTWQAILIIGVFAVLSIPLGIALREIAGRDQVARSVRAVLEEAARESGGRVTTLRVDASLSPVLVDAVLVTPRHRDGLAATVERRLAATLSGPVDLQLREVLTSDDAQLARERSAIAELARDIGDLRTRTAAAQALRSAREAKAAALRASTLARFGRMEISDDAERALLMLSATSGVTLDGARRMEAAMLRADPGTRFEVVPPPQALPWIRFADDSATLDPASLTTLDAVAWALRRWQARAVNVSGFAGGDPDLAQARADAVAAALRERGVAVDAATGTTQHDYEALAAAVGNDAARAARIELR